MSHNSLRMTLETVIMQPGIRPDLVFVCLDEKLEEQSSLVDLFGFQYVKLASSFNYTDIFHKALIKVWSPDMIEKEKQSLIVIEEELILSPDFLYYFTQVYDAFMNDPTVAAISSWNPNCNLPSLRLIIVLFCHKYYEPKRKKVSKKYRFVKICFKKIF